ncbi:FIST N domain protein [Candidatus Burarchaeum australiense]|nr:FIST N domain protein [Candidatus Burarchaeum australiense]
MKPILESAPAISVMTRQDAKSIILQILAEEWPLSAKDVYNRLRARHGPHITYQGVHKILGQLVLEDAVSLENKRYALRLDWIRGLRKFGETTEKKYLEQDVRKPYLEVGVGYSVEPDAFMAGKEAAAKALAQIKHGKPLQLTLVFTSSVYESAYERLSEGVRAVTRKAPLAGCSTFGEIANRPLTKSVVVMIFAADKEDFSAQTICLPVLPEQYHTGDFKETAAELQRQIRESGRTPDFGILLLPGYTKTNNLSTVAPALLKQLTVKSPLSFPLTGGIAGDDWHFDRNVLFYESKIYTDYLVLIAIRTRLKFGIAVKHSYAPVSANKFKVRMKDGLISELAKIEHGKPGKWRPCAEVYLKETGISSMYFEEVVPFMKEVITQNKALPLKNVNNNLLSFPFGIKGTSILFQNMIVDGDVVQVMRTSTSELEAAPSAVLREAINKAGIHIPVSALFFSCSAFECILSNQNRNEIAALRKGEFKSLPVGGFYGAGEVCPFSYPQASGTALAIVFGNELKG